MAKDRNQLDGKVAPGWYVFQDGKIQGPLTAVDAFKPGKAGQPDGRPERFVSRVGFQKWYPMDQVRPILKEVQRIEQANRSNTGALEKVLADNLERLENAATIIEPAVVARTVAGPEGAPALARSDLLGDAEPVIEPVPAPSRPDAEAVGTADASALTELNRIAPSYLTLKGRLRLGKSHSAWRVGTIDHLLTLGLNWLWWFHRAMMEVTYHTHNTHQHHQLKRWWLCALPGFHVIAARRLAVAVREMERQNGYQSTQPTLAMLLSFVPAAFMVYIQGKISSHWHLHVRHMQKSTGGVTQPP